MTVRDTVVTYLNTVVKYYQFIAEVNARTPSLKIISKEIDGQTKEPIYRVQISGKNLFPKISLSQITADQSLLLSFDALDQQEIAAAIASKSSSIQALTQPRQQKIFAKTYNIYTKQFIFTVGTEHDGYVSFQRLTAMELAARFPELDSFDKKDIFQIGFEAGKEFSSVELPKNSA